MKRVLTIICSLVLCLLITIVPAFAIQTGYYEEGQTMVHLLGGQYQVELNGIGDDALVLFDTRDMYWYSDDGSLNNAFETYSSSLDNPEVHVHNDITTDDTTLVYNDLVLYIDDLDFPTANTLATTYMSSDRFQLLTGASLGLHLSPIYNLDKGEYLVPPGDIVNATVTFCALMNNGNIGRVPVYRDDLVVGGTYDLTARLQEFFINSDVQYYWLEYEGGMVVPTFVQDFQLVGGAPVTNVHVVDFATDIVYPEWVSYENFNLLEWLGNSINGFLTVTIFSIGDVNITLGTILSIPITLMVLIVFLKKFAGG